MVAASDTTYGDLKHALIWSEKQLESFRRQRIEVLRQFAGWHYGENGVTDKIPVNVVNTYATIYQRSVAVNDPQILITSPHSELAASAAEYRLAVNEKIAQMGVEATFNECGAEALFLLGCCLVGIDENGDPVIEPVPFDDLILDMSAKSWRQVGYVGHRFRPFLSDVLENPEYDAEVKKKLAPSEYTESHAYGAGEGDSQSQTVTFGDSRRVEDYRKRVELTHLYLPEEGKLLIFANNDPDNFMLSEKQWQGPPQVYKDQARIGMYHFLRFIDVPGNLMPVGPAQLWRDIHDVINRLANKAFRQAERQKTVLTGGNEDDMVAYTNASDGEGIATSQPEKIIEKTTGGANQITLGMVEWLRRLGNSIAGNPDMLGGTAPTTDTVGQDQILMQGASTQVKQMQHRMLAFARNVLADVAWWMWTDPIGQQDVSRPIPGTNDRLTFKWDASRRKGMFEQYRLDIEPYSVLRRSPQEKLSALFNAMDKLTMQYGPQMQAAGMSFDMEKLVKTIADYANLPELAGMVVYQAGEQLDKNGNSTQPGGAGPGRPPNPQRPVPQQPQDPMADVGKMMMAGMFTGQPSGAR